MFLLRGTIQLMGRDKPARVRFLDANDRIGPMNLAPSLSKTLKQDRFPVLANGKKARTHLESLQLKMLRIQQGIWYQKKRAVILFEGFDASGKGGAIQRLVENIDPRGFRVHAIGPPTAEELSRHYLQRFWTKLPLAGTIAIFDRSWYGRVLVERVERLTPEARCVQGFAEIAEFEKILLNEGFDLIKFFFAIDKDEQLRRFEQRLQDPYKQWKLTEADVKARTRWNDYVKATDEMLQRTHTAQSPWHLIPAKSKHYARIETLSIATERLKHHVRWMEEKAQTKRVHSLEKSLRDLGLKESSLK